MRFSTNFRDRCFRAWLYAGEYRRVLARFEASFRGRHCLFDIGLDDDDQMLTFCWAVPLLFLSFSVRCPQSWIPSWGLGGGPTDVFRISVHDWSVYWSIWHPSNSWSSGTPRWRYGSFSFPDFFLGKREHSAVLVAEQRSILVMPEGGYPVTVQMKRETWKRRFWFAHTLMRAHITVDSKGGIPFPGKGESAHNCGDDAAFSMTCVAETAQEGLDALRKSVERDRVRNGGRGWKPDASGAIEISGAAPA